jgi:hypothetical protein
MIEAKLMDMIKLKAWEDECGRTRKQALQLPNRKI